eukprot:TRINITY_DN45059_c0_g1_i1.p1 TRINITY_DN45059_c0_g1~~TRINITY_DN45059_c0_g1_i1.p1  ORF type:complete len:155 (-),score=32.10 TRINITY_DN45059_c0_g1_i1:45-509(-)
MAEDDAASPASMSEWNQAVSELEQVDRTIAELREELQQFEVRRNVIAAREKLLRSRLAAAGQVVTPPSASNDGAGNRSGSEASPSKEPLCFSLDDGAGGPGSRSASLEDWEQGLDMLSAAGQTRDRAASLRAHWLMNGGGRKDSNSSPAKKAGY